MLNRFRSSPSMKPKIGEACAEAIRRGQINADAERQIMMRREVSTASVCDETLAIVLSGNIRGAAYYMSEIDDAQ